MLLCRDLKFNKNVSGSMDGLSNLTELTKLYPRCVACGYSHRIDHMHMYLYALYMLKVAVIHVLVLVLVVLLVLVLVLLVLVLLVLVLVLGTRVLVLVLRSAVWLVCAAWLMLTCALQCESIEAAAHRSEVLLVFIV